MSETERGGRRIFHRLATVEEALRALEGKVKAVSGEETVPTGAALWRVASKTVFSKVDLPPFDRAEMDGYAVISSDLEGSSETTPSRLVLLGRVDAGEVFPGEVREGGCVEIATGAPVPRGADAVVMVEYTSKSGEWVEFFRPVTPGENIAHAGSDIEHGEVLLRKGTVIGVKEVALLSAAGISEVDVYRRPKAGIISTGDELADPGSPLGAGMVYDANSNMLVASVLEAGGDPIFLGRAGDDAGEVGSLLRRALENADLVLISGGTSAGLGDTVYRVLGETCNPGILVHGLQIKPGKPAVIAVDRGKPVIGLPGYPVSALMVFNQIARPLIERMGGLPRAGGLKLRGKIAQRVNAAKGRRWFLPVHVLSGEGVRVYPVLAGSGAIGALARADGYTIVREDTEYLEEGEEVEVNLFVAKGCEDLVVMGSHCPALDSLLELVFEKEGIRSKALNVGSLGGLTGAAKGECDLAGVHLLDENTMEYNAPFVKRAGLPEWCLVKGYRRMQGIAVPKGNPMGISGLRDLVGTDLIFANRNRGSGTRILTDRILKEIALAEGMKFSELIAGIRGYRTEARTHSSVAAAVWSGRADLGVCIKSAAEAYGLDFIPIAEEEYDFVLNPQSRAKGAVRKFIECLRSDLFRERLKGFVGYSI